MSLLSDSACLLAWIKAMLQQQVSQYTVHSRSGRHRQGGKGAHLNSRRGIVTNSAGLLLTGNQQHIILDGDTDVLTSQPCKLLFHCQ